MLIFKTYEFIHWYTEQTKPVQYKIESRLKRLEEDHHWGFINSFDGLVELKWTSGLRVYTARIGQMQVVVLLGGHKNGQDKDIKKAKKILRKVKSGYFD